jgi:hypothetical protein
MYDQDLRSPLDLIPGQSKTWTFYLWATPYYSNIPISLTWVQSYYKPPFDKMQFTLTYVRAPMADGQILPPGDVSVGTSISLNDYRDFGSSGTWWFPIYRTTDGRTGYMFTLTATVIPEPTSLLALLSALGGFGVLLRRRVR